MVNCKTIYDPIQRCVGFIHCGNIRVIYRVYILKWFDICITDIK